ncbi:hypothetical protein K210099B7_20680 [Bacteroides xylanisolvens]
MDKIQEIFTAPWAIADNDYYRLLSLLVPCVAAGNLDAIEKRLDNNKITAYATTPYLANRWELDDDTLPADSVCGRHYPGRYFVFLGDLPPGKAAPGCFR